jgi:hypothetical protein
MIPTPEQQAATAAKFAKPVPYPIDDLRPTAAAPVEAQKRWYWKLAKWMSLFCFLAFVAGVVEMVVWRNSGHVETAHGSGLYLAGGPLMFASALTLCVFWMFFLFIGFFKVWFGLGWGFTKEALKPCPTPAEIEYELRARGYNPSIQDVLAVHAAAKREQYENVALAGGWFVANHLLGEHMRAAGQGPKLG